METTGVKALILTGGLGTRLRPFTLETAKPLLPVANIPFIHYQLRNLRAAGIREVILATAYRPEQFRRALGTGKSLGLTLRYAQENKPLGTGGAVRNCAKYLSETIVVLNGDVMQSIDAGELLKTHKRRRAEATITLVRVEDPSRFGLVETDAAGAVKRFLEKPAPDEITVNTINAGAYAFERSTLMEIPPGKPYSLERGLFPKLLSQRRPLFSHLHEGYWIDFGTVEKYLQIHLDVLGGSAPFAPTGKTRKGAFRLESGARLAPGARHQGPGSVLVGRSTTIGAETVFTGSASIGAGCSVGEGSSLEDCVLLDGVRVGAGSKLKRCIVGAGSRLGVGTTLSGGALGGGSRIKDFSQL